jgi:DNA modification methylase
MPKDIESLEKSREIRFEIIRKYGFVPTSVWEIDYSKCKHVIELDKRKQMNVSLEKQKKKNYDKRLPNIPSSFIASSTTTRGTSENAGLSTFPPELVRIVTLFYTEENDTILDPFCGHNSRLQIIYEMNRNYIGYDICEKFMQFNEEIKKEITGNGKQTSLLSQTNAIKFYKQSSEKLNEKDNSIDLIFTSPPYWCVEYYGPEPEQLGLCETYKTFLIKIEKIIGGCYRVLKKDKFCIFNVNDFRHKGKFYKYHCDIANLLELVGFKLHDIIIIKWQSSIGACFASQIEERKVTAKAHEYLIVGKKC